MRHYRTFFTQDEIAHKNCDINSEVTFKIIEDLLELYLEQGEPSTLDFDICDKYFYYKKRIKLKGKLQRASNYFILVFKDCPVVLAAFSLAYEQGLYAAFGCYGFKFDVSFGDRHHKGTEVVVHLFKAIKGCRGHNLV